MPRRSLVGLAAIVAAGVLFAGACGGDDDDADGSGRDDAPEDSARPDSDAADATTTTTAGGAADDGAAGSSADVDEIGEMDFCDGFRAAIRLDSTTALAGARQLEAPAEIAEDWQVFLDFAETSMSNDPAAAPDDVEAAGAAAEEATSRVLAYVGQECGYSVDAFTGEVTENDGG
jgi:hypothetical protein